MRLLMSEVNVDYNWLKLKRVVVASPSSKDDGICDRRQRQTSISKRTR